MLQRPPRSARTGPLFPDATLFRSTHIDAVLDQVDYAVELVGIDHVGVGSDFDGVGGELPDELRTVSDFPNFVAGLQARGYKDEAIRKILGDNLLRTWAAIEAGAGTAAAPGSSAPPLATAGGGSEELAAEAAPAGTRKRPRSARPFSMLPAAVAASPARLTGGAPALRGPWPWASGPAC